MRACTPFLLAPLALAGCGLNNDCWKYNPFGCAKGDESGGSAEATNPSSESTASPTTGDASSSSTSATTDSTTGMETSAPTTMGAPSTATSDPTSSESTDSSSSSESTTCPMEGCPECGNGVVEDGEECDDGNPIPDDGCDNGCVATRRRVFVTSTVYTGALKGVAGADAECQALAGAPMYKAWLSDEESSPSTRFDMAFTGLYVLSDQNMTVVAHGWQGLTTPPLMNAINLDESGDPIGREDLVPVWTNTDFDGASASINNCIGWTSTEGISTIGNAKSTTGEWTNYSSTQLCDAPRRLYCFEDK